MIPRPMIIDDVSKLDAAVLVNLDSVCRMMPLHVCLCWYGGLICHMPGNRRRGPRTSDRKWGSGLSGDHIGTDDVF